MALLEIDVLDIFVLALIALGTLRYLARAGLSSLRSKAASLHTIQPKIVADISYNPRDIISRMSRERKACVIFYGSQTGTAENYASRLAKEAKSRFGLETMVADLDDYDLDQLHAMPEGSLVGFVLATYGEGEPTDNAVLAVELMTGDHYPSMGDDSLRRLNYVAFGLGNSTYQSFNSVITQTSEALDRCGASCLGPVGKGDDGAGTLDEDFITWKEKTWAVVAAKYGLQDRGALYQPMLTIHSSAPAQDASHVYLGEPNKQQLEGIVNEPFDTHNPFIATVASSRELFTRAGRNCVHLELDVQGATGLAYRTGDHVAVWPSNFDQGVDLFLEVFGLAEKRHDVIEITALDSTTKIPVPSPTTYDAVARHYLEICAPVSRQLLALLADFAPSTRARAEAKRLSSDKDTFQREVKDVGFYTLASLLHRLSNGEAWLAVPFTALIETLPSLQPRYYSISSSALVQPTRISVTAVVDAQLKGPHHFKGVASNFLLAIKLHQNGESHPDAMQYDLSGPRRRYQESQIPIHIRHSSFKLPDDPSKPLIMVGPGTGVAPFRAFVQERAQQFQDGLKIGKMILFIGCRRPEEDYIYEAEWKAHRALMGDTFEVVTAFSRQTEDKIYVQHRLAEKTSDVVQLLEEGGYFYVCGDAANMARSVAQALAKAVADHRGIPISDGADFVRGMRESQRYQEDVW